MACLSQSASGRRLSELLEEQQEPFLLDVHLLEKGCPSTRLLDGYGAACWPGALPAAELRRLTSKRNKASCRGGRKQRTPAGVLKLLLSKILRTTAACSRRPPALQCSDSFKSSAVAPAPLPCPDRLETIKTAGGEGKEDSGSCSDSESSYDEKQRSPVSVLDHPFETSPGHSKLSPIGSSKLASPARTAAIDAFRDLLDAAYSPALLTQLLAKSDDLAAAAYDDDEEDCYAYHRAELARVSALVAAEVPCARLDAAAAALQPEREDVGAGVADAVLHALLQELVVDLC